MRRTELCLALTLAVLASACVTAPTRPSGIYFVMVDRFANGDRTNDGPPGDFHGGDLRGLIDHLDWIAQLGFDTVWLSPIFEMRTEPWNSHAAFHGYWTWDLSRLEPRFGEERLLKELRAQLDRRGMKLVLDLVLNHVGPDAPVLSVHPEWFHHHGGITDWNDPRQLTDFDVHGLPDLAVEKPEVFAHLTRAAQKWVDLARPDGFRLDAVKHVPVSFWQRFNSQFEHQIRLGELLDGRASEIAKIWGEGHFTSMFDFPLGFAIVDVFCRGASPSRIAAVLTDDRRYSDPSALVTLVDNHDLPRLMSVCGGDVEKAKNALTFLLAMRGTPSIIWGTEVGFTGEREPENRQPMRFEPHPLALTISDGMKRRAQSPALRDGSTQVAALTADRLSLDRVADDGATIRVTVDRGVVGFEPRPTRPTPAARVTRRVRFEGKGAIAGSGVELGDWSPARAIVLPAALDLPVGGVFEFKRLVDGKWVDGENEVVWVTEQTEVIQCD